MSRFALVAAAFAILSLFAPHAQAGNKGGNAEMSWKIETGERASAGEAFIVDLRTGDALVVEIAGVSFSRDASGAPIAATRFGLTADGVNSIGRWMDAGTELAIELTLPTAEGTYLKYKLDRCFVKSWSTSGDADDRPTEEVAFYYNRIP